jgi:hypothetical protein
MRTVLFDRSAGHNADFAKFERVIDFRPGQLFVTVFLGSA